MLGGEGRGEMRSGRYWWVEWAPWGRSHPRVQFYISQREWWIILFSAAQIAGKEGWGCFWLRFPYSELSKRSPFTALSTAKQINNPMPLPQAGLSQGWVSLGAWIQIPTPSLLGCPSRYSIQTYTHLQDGEYPTRGCSMNPAPFPWETFLVFFRETCCRQWWPHGLLWASQRSCPTDERNSSGTAGSFLEDPTADSSPSLLISN